MEDFIFPQMVIAIEDDDVLFSEDLANEALHNTVNALMLHRHCREIVLVKEFT